jgi:hypothetical protein
MNLIRNLNKLSGSGVRKSGQHASSHLNKPISLQPAAWTPGLAYSLPVQ